MSKQNEGKLTYPLPDQQRLDLFLVSITENHSRVSIQKNIKQGHVTVNGRSVKPNYKLQTSDEVNYKIVDLETTIDDVKPEPIDLNIIYENDHALVINKQSGLVAHPTSSLTSNTLVNALLHSQKDIQSAVYDSLNTKSQLRPGIVHRLDKDTTGVMIVAKTAADLIYFSKQIKEKAVEKKYLAICVGWPTKRNGEMRNYLGRNIKHKTSFTEVGEAKGKLAISEYKVIQHLKDPSGNTYSLIEFIISTGRTHQIRTQSAIMGHPVLGDQTYFSQRSKLLSARLAAKRQMLHSFSLKIIMPGKKSASLFEAEPPEDFKKILSKLTQI